MRAQRWRTTAQAQAAPARLAFVAAVVAFAGLVALPFAGSLGEPTDLVTGAAAPTTTTTAAPPAAPAPAPAEVPPADPPPAPAPDAIVVEPPPIVVDDPSAGVGEVAAPLPVEPVGAPDPSTVTVTGGSGSVAGPAAEPVPGRVPTAATAPPSAPPPPPSVSEPPPTPATPAVVPHPERLWVVSIGIDDYQGDRHDLAAARADAITVTDTMAGLGVPADHLYELLDGEATVEGVLAAVDWLVANAGPDDTALFFYAGHVRDLDFGTEVIVTADNRWIADWFLADRFALLQADDAWFAIAGCFGGGFQELLGPGRILTGAADPDELAYESSAFGRSYMVEYLFQRAVAQRMAPEPTVQAAVAWANAELGVAYPDFTLWHADESGHVVSLDGGDRNEAPPPTTTPVQPTPPTATPPRQCVLGLLCD